MNKRKFLGTLGVVGLSVLMALAPASNAAVDFVFNFTDASGVGFNAVGQTGIDRRAGLNQAAGIVEALFVNYNAVVNIDVNGSETNNETLASAGSNFNGPFGPGFGNQGDVQIKILGGTDPSAGADGTVNWNFEDFSWEPLNDFQAGEQDLISTAAHELLHAVGFSSDVAQNGNDPGGNTPGNTGNWAPFDRFIADSTGSLVNSTSFALDGTRWNTASVGGTGATPAANGLYFDAPNATAANGGNPVPLYSAAAWDDGSSLSHLDTAFFTGANAKMMNHASPVSEGLDIRVIDDITIGILKDIGFTQIVPEPAALAVLGFVGAVLIGRRRVG